MTDTIHNINTFYDIFWEVLTYGYEFNAQSHFNYDILNDVVYDINKILDYYEYDETDPIYRWLDRLCDDVARFRDSFDD